MSEDAGDGVATWSRGRDGKRLSLRQERLPGSHARTPTCLSRKRLDESVRQGKNTSDVTSLIE